MPISTDAFYALSHEQKREYMNRVVAERDAEIAKLRAERDEWQAKAHSLNSDRAAARIEAEKQLTAARAALDGERDACDNGVAALTAILDAWSIGWMPHLRNAVRKFVTEQQNRRAAEANGEPK